MVVYCVCFIFVTWLTDICELKLILIMANTMTLFGSILKLVAVCTREYWVYEVGQVLCAFAECFILLLPSTVANKWFPDAELGTATAIGVFGNQLGIGISFIIPPYLITELTNSTVANFTLPNETSGNYSHAIAELATVKEEFIYLTAGVTVVAVILLVATLLSPAAPEHYPSEAAQLADKTHRRESQSFQASNSFFKTLVEIKQLLTFYPSYIALTLSYGLLVGVYYALLGNLSIIIGSEANADSLSNSERSADQHAGSIGLSMILFGGVGSVIIGQIIDHTQSYKIVSTIVYGATLVFYAVFTGTFHLNILALHYVILSLLGLSMLSYVQIGYDFGAELTWPVPGAVSAAFNNVVAMLVGAILTPLMNVALNHGGPREANIVLLAILAAGFILNLFVTETITRPKNPPSTYATLKLRKK